MDIALKIFLINVIVFAVTVVTLLVINRDNRIDTFELIDISLCIPIKVWGAITIISVPCWMIYLILAI